MAIGSSEKPCLRHGSRRRSSPSHFAMQHCRTGVREALPRNAAMQHQLCESARKGVYGSRRARRDRRRGLEETVDAAAAGPRAILLRARPPGTGRRTSRPGDLRRRGRRGASHRDRRRRRRRAGAGEQARQPARSPRAGAHHAGRLRADPRLETAAARGRGRHAARRCRRPRLLRPRPRPSLPLRARPDERARPRAQGDRARPGAGCQRCRGHAAAPPAVTTPW